MVTDARSASLNFLIDLQIDFFQRIDLVKRQAPPIAGRDHFQRSALFSDVVFFIKSVQSPNLFFDIFFTFPLHLPDQLAASWLKNIPGTTFLVQPSTPKTVHGISL